MEEVAQLQDITRVQSDIRCILRTKKNILTRTISSRWEKRNSSVRIRILFMHKAKKYIWRRGWSNGRIRSVLLLALCSLLFLTPSGLIFAQTDGSGKLSITIAPPLFQISIAPGTLWQRVLRVVNTNHYPLVVHTNVADFRPSGETGNAVFDTLSQGSALDTLRMSGWITVPSGDITIPPDASYEIPFSINVPINA